LTSIRSFSEILLTLDVDPNTQREFMGIINGESERLTRLINDVLDITKIESGYVEWHMQSLDLFGLMRASGRTITSLAEEKQLKLEVTEPDEPIFVWADSDRILQVLANLLGNAVKFTSEGEIVLWAEIAGDMAVVHVRDTGIGIAPADHDRIFQKFHQLGNSLTDKPTGTGLGLAICRDIIEHHGGQIFVTSARGQGSVFSLTLPLAHVPAPPSRE
jgi:signal transduction histidine kinase